MILISLITIIISVYILRKKHFAYWQFSNLWILFGLLILISIIFWTIYISFIPYSEVLSDLYTGFIPSPDEGINVYFWFFFDLGFGIIGQFTSGVLIILAGMLSKRYRETENTLLKQNKKD